eukprot:TRINITY_DN40134_c1_g2_i1.p1 TRINITY_DN40134_c1_g2~~TRINITY_DN40134_c1_g2_i1.p1  ORF type:complete len:236 (+),score=41.46 TRINITY_DN40134_c1_g2_i1:181-888(+)
MVQVPRHSASQALFSKAPALLAHSSQSERGSWLPRNAQETKVVTVIFDATDPLGEKKEREREKRRQRRERQQSHKKWCEAMEALAEAAMLSSRAVKSDEHDFLQKQPSLSEPCAPTLWPREAQPSPSETYECTLWQSSTLTGTTPSSPCSSFAAPMYVTPSPAYFQAGTHDFTGTRPMDAGIPCGALVKYCRCCGKIINSNRKKALHSVTPAGGKDFLDSPEVVAAKSWPRVIFV